jgi:hypothetical protein
VIDAKGSGGRTSVEIFLSDLREAKAVSVVGFGGC